ncbi:MAG: beta-phosphoglucomutase family hydrolase [Candidatus Omnitrophica bacterium]|nr:beta-phosphoglucomutase family hydrolase [Candidatus Omnitrophota bacterium]
MAELKGLIFDMDGVIVNTVPLHFEAWKKMFSDYGVEFNFEDYKKKVDGIPRLAGTGAILTDFSDDKLKEAADKKQGYFTDLITTKKVEVYEDTLAFLNSLDRDALKIAVASSSKNCKDILRKAGLSSIFDAVVDGYGFNKGKPDAEIFLNASRLLKLNSFDCVVFEDAEKGVEAAKNGNMACVGVDRHNQPQLLSKADLIINNFSQISLEMIEKIVIDQ